MLQRQREELAGLGLANLAAVESQRPGQAFAISSAPMIGGTLNKCPENKSVAESLGYCAGLWPGHHYAFVKAGAILVERDFLNSWLSRFGSDAN